jgi:hypothetical protein
MADGVAVTAGSGTTILTDDTGATGHAQVIKLAISTDGSPTLIPADGANGLDVDVTRLPAPLTTTGTGTEAAALRVTIATDSTGVLSIDDNGASLTVDGTVTANLAAGTNNIGDVDVLTLPAPLGTAGAASIAKAEDAASATADVGVASMAIRKATPANTSDTDGDYEMLQMSAGRLWTSTTIDAALPAGANNIGDVDVLTLPSIPAGTNNIGDVDVLTLPALPAGTNNIGDVDVLTVPAPLNVTGTGTEAAALRVTIATDSTGVLSVDDNGGTLTVDNAALSVVGNGAAATALRVSLANDSTGIVALTTSTASIGKLAANTGVDIGDVDVTSVITGTGATNLGKAIDSIAGATDTGVALLAVRDDVLAALTPVDGDYVPLRTDSTGALWTSTVLGAGTNNIGDVDVLTLPALPAGTNNIGDVDVLTLPALPAGNNNIGDVDIATIAAGDNNIGNVDIVTMPNVTLAAGTNTNEVVGDVAHDAPAAGNPLLVGGFASAAAPTAVSTDGDMVRAWHLLNGAQATALTAAGALIGGDATNGLDVDVTRLPAPLTTTGTGTEATALRVTIATDSTGVLSVDDNGGTLTVDNTTLSVVGNGAAATALRVSLANDSTGIVALTTSTASIGKLAANSGIDIGDVDVTSIIPLTGATNLGKAIDSVGGATDTGVAVLAIRDDALTTLTPVDGDYVALRTDATGQLWVNPQGNVAHDIADAGNPIKLGLKAKTSPKGLTLVADNDRTDAYADLDGIQITKIGTANSDLISERVADTGGTSTAFTNFSAVASTRNYVTAIAVFNTSASACSVDFRDGAAGAVLWTMYCPAGGGSVITSAIPLFKTTAATALAYDVSGAITTCYINVSGFQSKA